MKPMERFADLGRLLEEDDRFLIVAQHAVAALGAMTEHELELLRDSATEREAIFEEIWNEVVEPAPRTGDAHFEAWQMSFEGVVIDHIMRLWTAGRTWRERTENLIPVPA